MNSPAGLKSVSEMNQFYLIKALTLCKVKMCRRALGGKGCGGVREARCVRLARQVIRLQIAGKKEQEIARVCEIPAEKVREILLLS